MIDDRERTALAELKNYAKTCYGDPIECTQRMQERTLLMFRGLFCHLSGVFWFNKTDTTLQLMLDDDILLEVDLNVN